MDYTAIGKRIRAKRKQKDLSQEELAEMVNISTVHMSHIETGNTKLSLPVLVAISLALEVQTDELLFETANTSRSGSLYEITALLENCTPQQLRILKDVIRATKTALQKYS